MNLKPQQPATPSWARLTLILAGAYNLIWGAWVVLFPDSLFRWLALEEPNYPQLWQCLGMVIGVYGIGYLVAARDPARHWPIVLVGLLGKVFGPLGFLLAAVQGDLPWAFGATILLNDLIWWIPFAALLIHAFRIHSDTATGGQRLSLAEALDQIESHRGPTLGELSEANPVLVVMLRHSGCTFCREALADLAQQRREIEAAGLTLAIVHLDTRQHGAELTRRYELDDIHRFSDPECRLYEAFDLSRGRFLQLLGPRVLLRALPALLIGRHGLGRIRGDGFRMPGAFVIHDRKIVAAYRHRTAADRPSYEKLASEAVSRLRTSASGKAVDQSLVTL